MRIGFNRPQCRAIRHSLRPASVPRGGGFTPPWRCNRVLTGVWLTPIVRAMSLIDSPFAHNAQTFLLLVRQSGHDTHDLLAVVVR